MRSMWSLGCVLFLPFVLGSGISGCGSSSSSTTVANNVILNPASGLTLSSGVQYEFYEQRFSISSGGTSPYSFGEKTDGLPDGLFLVSVDSSGQALSTSDYADVIGFPQVAGTDTVEFQVYDANNDLTEPTYGITIATATGSGLVVSPATGTHLSNGTVGTAYGPVTLTIGNGTPGFTWRVVYGSLPGGLTLQPDPSGSNSAEAQIGGTPSAAGTWVFAIEATDSATTPGHGGAVYQITVQ